MARTIELTARDIRQVELLAAMGHTQGEIALLLDFSERTFRSKKEADAELAAAWERGKLKAKANVGAVAYRNALDGDQRAVEYYEATRFGISAKAAALPPGSNGADELNAPPEVRDPHTELLRRLEGLQKREDEADAKDRERVERQEEAEASGLDSDGRPFEMKVQEVRLGDAHPAKVNPLHAR
jgi:hypothetical protein